MISHILSWGNPILILEWDHKGTTVRLVDWLLETVPPKGGRLYDLYMFHVGQDSTVFFISLFAKGMFY